MSGLDLMRELQARGAEFWFEGDRLRFRAPRGVVQDDQRAVLAAERAELVGALRSEAERSSRTFPLSFSQQSLWLLNQQAPDSAAYHVALCVRVLSPVTRPALAQAVQALVDRHAALRTTYAYDEHGSPSQRVAGARSASFETFELPGASGAELRRAVEADYVRPFDLEQGPVMRVSLYTVAPADHVLLLTVHHIAADGWSLMTLTDELFRLYAEANGGPPAQLPRLAVEYSDYVTWQSEFLAGAEGERLWQIWREKLAPPRAPLELPTSRPRPELPEFRGASLPVELDAELTLALKQHAVREGTTPFVWLLACFHALLFRITGASDVIVGTPTFGRSKSEFMRVVGDFVNSVPLRSRPGDALAFNALVAQLKRATVDGLDAQEFPLSLLVQRLHPERDSSRSPLFDTLFILQRFDQFKQFQSLLAGDDGEPPVEIAGLALAPYPLSQQEGQFDLALQMVERDGVLHGVFKYRTDLLDEATVKEWARVYGALVRAVVANPEVTLGSLPAPAVAPGDGVAALLARLQKSDVQLSVSGGKLKVNAPKGALTDELKAAIGAQREAIIRALEDGRQASGRDELTRIPRTGQLPVSSAQQRLWFLDRMEPGKSQYNIGARLALLGPLEPELLKRTLDELTRDHESLRTTIGERDGGPDVRIHEPSPARFEFVDLSSSPPEAAETEATRLIAELLRKPFDLGRGPLAAYLLVRLAPERHAFAMCFHHAISDGWSMLIAFQEICRTYDTLARGGTLEQRAATIDYVDYAAWERKRLQSPQTTRELAFWKKELAGLPALLDLPTDRPRPAKQSFVGGRLNFSFDPALVEAVKRLARQQETTLFMLLLASWQLLLHRVSGQSDLAVGSPVANRELPAFESVVGCFVNNVVFRSRLDTSVSFAEYLGAVKNTALAVFEQRQLPFDVLVDGVRPERSTNHAPIFQVLFTLQSFLQEVPPVRGLEIRTLDTPDTGIARFDLALELAEYEGRFRAMYEYSSDLFDEATIRRLHARFEKLLAALVAEPNARVGEVSLLVPEDERLLASWNATELEHDRSRTIHGLLEASARETPDAVAVVAASGSLTYRELDERANRLAHLLQQKGVKRGALVAVCVDRTADMPVALAAALKAGAAYVPLDPGHPADRLRYVLEDAGVACVITLSEFAPLLGTQVPSVLLDRAEDELSRAPATPVGVAVEPADLAYVIYTSGSTGKPKGVEVEHRNVVAFLEAMRRAPGFTRADRLLAVTTLSFDIAGLEMWLPLSLGARITVASRRDALDGEQLMAMLAEHQITVLQATPATFRLLIESGWTGKPDLKVLCGGEALPRDLAQGLLERVGELWNVYGPTETTVWSTVTRIEDASAPITIGRPIHNTRIHVLEPSGRLAPIGVTGELCIAGEGVARGYRNRPELTADKFKELTIAEGGRPERLYKTGDMARIRSDGRIDFLGRRDHQVKIRGYRIELGEIEAALAAHPGVKECVVVAREDTPGDQRLVAYAVEDGAPLDAEAARATLRKTLPEYMLPNTFVTLAALPLTPNGKIDRKALPAPQAQTVQAEEQPDVLMTPVQRRVAAAWKQILKANRVGLYDNFFDIGGHSLLVVKLHAALKREFSRDIRLVDLFQWTTVAAQAERLSSAATGQDAIERAKARAARQNNG